ncbi:MAG: sensor histidine kinase [Fimbriimonadales bacterium]|nr:sensor histidine kinase [Fimbriimonadales bacterium]
MTRSETLAHQLVAPCRTSPEDIRLERERLLRHPLVIEMLEGYPGFAAILDSNRQILAINQKARELIRDRELDSVIGLRIGEAIGCIHAVDSPNGCGGACACLECGALQAVRGNLETNQPRAEEARLELHRGGQREYLDVMVYTSTVHIDGEPHTIVSIKDIADEKRRQLFERLFFHDVLNTAAAINSIASVLQRQENLEDVRSLTAMLAVSAEQLIQELHAQRDLMDAERGELKVHVEPITIHKVLHVIENMYASHDLAEGRTFRVVFPDSDALFETGRVHLVRSIGNLVKNALEATPREGEVSVSGRQEGADVVFEVRNDGVMPEQVQRQIFRRSFTTKAEAGRGLGTYSVKLLVESYLKGSVSFVSNPEVGTVFTIRVPVRFRRAG